MDILNLTKENFQHEVLECKQTVLLDFWAPWCGPCRTVAPVLEEIARERPDIHVCKVNVDEQNELAAQFKIASIPTLMVIQNSAITSRISGAIPKADILKML